MNLNSNYYSVLAVPNTASIKEIKKAYRDLSKVYHPDVNNSVDSESIFKDISEAYKVLIDTEKREEYNKKSRFGNNYNEYYELFDINFDTSYDKTKDKYETFKKNEVFNIHILIDDTFDGKLEYERWVLCKTCDGSGKDMSSKIHIKDINGNILKTFDSDGGCDFCEGSGKDYANRDCSFCSGQGKVGINPCKTCKGSRRILGKQKLSGIKLTGTETKIDAMGHYSKDEYGKVGYLLLINNQQSSE